MSQGNVMTHGMKEAESVYGIMAEFDGPSELIAAAKKTRAAGYRRYDAYSPYPIEEVIEAMEIHDGRLPVMVLLGGVAGAITGFVMQSFASAGFYPLNIGGRPLISVPMFIPVTFELTILFAAFTAVFGMLALNGLPMPYHPVFNVDSFRAYASRNKFYLCIESTDRQFDRESTARFLEGLKPVEVHEVPH